MISQDNIMYALALSNLRRASGKKQFDVAQGLGLKNQQTVSDYEQGKKHFTQEFIQKICSFFKIKESEFKRLAKKLDNSSEGQTPTIISNADDDKIKSLFYQKENVELKIKNARLEFQVHEMQCKLKSLRFDEVKKNIYVPI